MSKQPTMREVITHLQAEGYGDENLPEAAAEHLAKLQTDAPWFVQGLAGCGGWIAAIFFTSFASCWITFIFGDADTTTISITAMVWGLIFLGLSFGLRSLRGGIFMNQLTLALHITGQVLFLSGVYFLMEATGTATVQDRVRTLGLAIIAMQLIVIPFYNDNLVRFLSFQAIVAALLLLIFSLDIPLALSFLAAALAVGTTALWIGLLPPAAQILHRPLFQPLSYALPVALFAVLITELVAIRIPDQAPFSLPLLTALTMVGLVAWAEVTLLRDYKVSWESPLALGIFGVTLLFALPALTTPGILAVLLVAVLGFRRRDTLLQSIAYVFLAAFITYFYYSLNTTLLVKSLIMMSSGLVLLGGRLWLRRAETAAPDVDVQEATL